VSVESMVKNKIESKELCCGNEIYLIKTVIILISLYIHVLAILFVRLMPGSINVD